MIVKHKAENLNADAEFESSVNSYDSQTVKTVYNSIDKFESSVNSYDSQTNASHNIL